MSDLIDRQAAIDAIERNAYRHTYIDQIVDIINDLPSVQPDVPGTNVGELISREYAIDAFMKATSDGDKVDFCIGVIKSVPSAQTRKGKWISVCNGKQCICSKCGTGYDHTYEFIEEWNYCPRCGCRMEEGDSDEKD